MSNSSKQEPSFDRVVPDGDQRERLVCSSCGYIQYENPKVVAGAVCLWEGKVLLGRRGIEPREGYWTIPAGYLELNETVEAGAEREAWEEMRARLTIDGLLAVYSIPRISQVQVLYRAQLVSPDVAVGEETLEVGLFAWDDVPWDELAFPSVRWALEFARSLGDRTVWTPSGNPPGELGDYR